MAALYSRRTQGEHSYVIMLHKGLEGDVGGRGTRAGADARVWCRAGVARRRPGRWARGRVLAEQRLAADCLQPPLRSRFRQQLSGGIRADTLRASARMRRSLRSQPGSAPRFAPPNQAASPAAAAVKPLARRPRAGERRIRWRVIVYISTCE